jgi:carbon-monoxide dehydrogenase small subunit
MMPKPEKQTIELDIDGEIVDVAIRPHQLLVDVIRDGCGRMSVKEGCESASCGACTVLIDGRPSLACITLAVDTVGRKIRTAEGLSPADGPLHPLQEAFVKHHAIQCGFCTPGMLMASVALLDANPKPNEEEIRAALAGNLCRCTGYVRIVQAIADAARSTVARTERRVAEGVR